MAGRLRKIRWYASRLRSMEPGERLFRVREAIRKRLWARRSARGWGNYEHIGDGEIGSFAPLGERLRMAASICPAVLAEAESAFDAGNYSSLGRPAISLFAMDSGIDDAFWFNDPVSGHRWPGSEKPAFDVAVRWTGEGLGDVKYVWELNRLQFLQPLAAAVAASDDAALARRVLDVVHAWASANPPGRGVNWVSGLELALRLVSLAVVVAGIGESRLEPADRVLIRRMAAAHGRQLAAFPSGFSSANNHLVAEGLGLLVAGWLAPDLPEARGWARAGRAVIEAEALAQVHPDGVGAEQSPTYHAFTLEMVALALLLSSDTPVVLPKAIPLRLAAGARFLMALANAEGRVPAIGDDDEGHVVFNTHAREERYCVSVAAAVGGLLGEPELVGVPRETGLRDLVFASPPAAETPWPERAEVQVFPCGGYTVVRDTCADHRIHLVFDHGPHGHTALAAHGHCDPLAIWLSVDGQPVFADAGTWLYHAGGDMRRRQREAGLHNTLLIGDRSPAQAAGAFAWTNKSNAEFLLVRTGPDWAVAGRHAGYLRDFGVHHVRRIERDGDAFRMVDTLEGAREVLPVSIRFLCDPAVEPEIEGGKVVLSKQGVRLLEMEIPAGFRCEIRLESLSPRFGELVPTRQVVLHGALAPNAVAQTAISLAARQARVEHAHGGTVVTANWAKSAPVEHATSSSGRA